MKKLLLVTAAFGAVAMTAEAKVSLATPFNDKMVLQREMPVRIWGTADAGEKVTVSFAGQEVSTKACEKGKWLVTLEPMAASKENRTLTVTGSKDADSCWLNCWGLFAGEKDVNTLEIKDVLVGEVWFCAGQSNTDCPIWGSNPRYRDGNGAIMLQKTVRPFVRLVKTPLVPAPKPRLDYKATWMEMTPEMYKNFMTNKWRMPSAMGYYFALELFNAIDIPIGLVDSSWGGTNIDAWTPTCGTASRPDLKDILEYKTTANKKDWNDKCRKGPIGGYQQQPAFLWNGMVAAYAPMAIRGFIWYQGCHNGGEPQRYCSKMHALYNGWAKEFQNPDLKLYFAQIAPFGGAFHGIRLAQAQFEKEQKNSAMAILSDVGNKWDIHPNDKWTVGMRLAVHALKRDYGFNDLRDNSPTLKSYKIEGDKFVLSFNDVDSWYVYNNDRSLEKGFEIAGADGKFVPAQIQNYNYGKDRNGNKTSNGVIKGKDLIVSAEGVKEPKKLRYLGKAPCEGALYNESCLPLGAFKID